MSKPILRRRLAHQPQPIIAPVPRSQKFQLVHLPIPAANHTSNNPAAVGKHGEARNILELSDGRSLANIKSTSHDEA